MKRVILCRPSGPRNLGTVVRAAANFGPVEVAVVGPIKPSLTVHPDYEQMSHGVEEYADRVEIFDSLSDALLDCHESIGFTARIRNHRETRAWSELVPRCLAADRPDRRLALVFGTEESGLSSAEAGEVMTLVHIATSSEHTSLNLGVAVSIALQSLFGGQTPTDFQHLRAPLSGVDRAYLKAHLSDTLGGIATSDSARTDIEASVERLFSHAEIETRDARAWHTIMRALGNQKSPPDYGLAGSQKEARRKQALERALGSDTNFDSKLDPR